MNQPEVSKATNVWSQRTIGFITVFFGVFVGFLAASFNLYRMGQRRKALLHLLAIPVMVFIHQFFLAQYIGLSSRYMVSTISDYLLRFIAYLILVFVTAAYLYKTTEVDIKQFNGETVRVGIRWITLFIIVGVILPISVISLHSSIELSQERQLQNHVYCELLTPGMTYEDVDLALLEIGQHIQSSFYDDYKPDNAPSDVDYFKEVIWVSLDVWQRETLRTGLGYDENDRLVWITRDKFPEPTPVNCPLYPDS